MCACPSFLCWVGWSVARLQSPVRALPSQGKHDCQNIIIISPPVAYLLFRNHIVVIIVTFVVVACLLLSPLPNTMVGVVA